MSDDALERLKKRQRPTVPSRDSSLTTSNVDISISGYQEQQISTSRTESLVTKQTSIRLEAELLQRLSDVCTKNNLSREVFIEALFEHYEEDSIATRESILSNAIRKAEHRLGIANKKRAKSMMEKFNP